MRLVYLSWMLAWSLAGAGPEVKNLLQVNEHIYRGAQPTDEGLKALAKMGIKTVVDLREKAEQSGGEQQAVEKLGMRFLSVPMTMHSPNDQQVAQVLGVLEQSASWPVFIHCRGGKDRTGTVIACYRISHDGWDNKRALAEAQVHGLSMLDVGMRRYILQYRGSPKSGSTK